MFEWNFELKYIPGYVQVHWIFQRSIQRQELFSTSNQQYSQSAKISVVDDVNMLNRTALMTEHETNW